ncbi:MAG: RNase adapter RapZ [Gammaproteobacteria bacterium]|nr:MAG: RNase adapter RapZ [Gammaproteobacteria bacterium]
MNRSPERVLIVSGLSGAGKTVALHALEDVGFHCIDNFPAALLPTLFSRPEVLGSGRERVAIGIDARNPEDSLAQVPAILGRLREQGLRTELIFVRADEATLLQRFSETRRRHPLTAPDRPLHEALEEERRRLEPLLEMADLCLDTSGTSIHALRALIREHVAGDDPQRLSLQLLSFGFKHGLPSGANFIFDVRCLPNPHWVPELRDLSGQDPAVAAYLEGHPQVGRMAESIGRFLEEWLPAFEEEGRSYLSVALGCTGGHHRSVYLVEMLAQRLRGAGHRLLVTHRDLSNPS